MVRMPRAPPIPIRAPSKGVTLRPWVLRDGSAWAGPPSSSVRVLNIGPRTRPMLFEALIWRVRPGSVLSKRKEGLSLEMLAMTMPKALVASM